MTGETFGEKGEKKKEGPSMVNGVKEKRVELWNVPGERY